jgi:CheY-like chemotaxis protein
MKYSLPVSFFLIDDDPDDIMLFREVVEDIDKDINFLSATNGRDGLNILNRENFSMPMVIFLDLNMPKMDGRECLKEIKNNDRLKDIPVVIYTTSSHLRDIEETRNLGAKGFISKPSSLVELHSVLNAIAESIPNDLDKTLKAVTTRPGLSRLVNG